MIDIKGPIMRKQKDLKRSIRGKKEEDERPTGHSIDSLSLDSADVGSPLSKVIHTKNDLRCSHANDAASSPPFSSFKGCWGHQRSLVPVVLWHDIWSGLGDQRFSSVNLQGSPTTWIRRGWHNIIINFIVSRAHIARIDPIKCLVMDKNKVILIVNLSNWLPRPTRTK